MMNLHKLADLKKLPMTLLGAVFLLMQSGTVTAEQPPDTASLARGAKSWAQNCARCHNMRDTSEFSDSQWKVIVTHMRVRAGLTEQESRDITLFLQENN